MQHIDYTSHQKTLHYLYGYTPYLSTHWPSTWAAKEHTQLPVDVISPRIFNVKSPKITHPSFLTLVSVWPACTLNRGENSTWKILKWNNFFCPVFYSIYFENISIEFTVSSSDSSDDVTDVIASSLDSNLMSRVIFAKGKVSTCYIGIELKMVKQSWTLLASQGSNRDNKLVCM